MPTLNCIGKDAVVEHHRAVPTRLLECDPQLSVGDPEAENLLETGVPIPKRLRKDCPLLGVHRGWAIYLLYNGVLGDRRPQGGNVLTRAVLNSLPPHPGDEGALPYDGPPKPSQDGGEEPTDSKMTGSQAVNSEKVEPTGSEARRRQKTPSEKSGTAGPRVIFGEACRLSDATLDAENIVFRQVPLTLKEAR